MTTKKLNDYTREELLDEVKRLKKRKTFGLVWENKEEQVAEDCKVRLPVLSEVTERNISGDSDAPTHLIIEGDNYHSLSALSYTHAGTIDLIYIDPPYNTGKNDFIYNDRYVSEDDAYKHSKWISFMYKRLRLAHDLLSEDGVLVSHIDEHEVDNLYQILTQIFGEDNNLGRIIWDKRNPKGDSRGISILNETILCFAKNSQIFLAKAGVVKRKKLNSITMQKKAMRLKNNIGKRVLPEDVATAVNPFGYPQQILDNLKVTYTQNLARKEYQKWLTRQNFSAGEKAYRYIDDEGRIYRTASMAWPNNKKAPDAYFIPLNHPVTNLPCPVPSKGWRNPPETMRALMDKGLIIFGEDEKKQPERKYYLDENMNENTPSIISYGGSDDKLFRELGLKFDNPKPLYIAQYLIESIHKEGCTVLDFFAGSGTTGHAVLALNSTNKCQRKFILCTNNENSIAEEITYPRIKKIIEGYGSTQGIPANIRYFKTDFVDKQKSTDGTRAALVARCADMIRIRENCFDQIVDEKSHKFYANADKFVAVIFDPFSLGSVWKELEAANTSSLPVSLYVFSYSQYAYEDEIPETHLEYKSIPIPESILEVYQRIFRKQENGNV